MKRRVLLKSLATVPILMLAGSSLAAVNSGLGTRFKLSLNTYSFNRLLRAGAVDLFDLQNHNEFLKTAADVDELFERVDSEWLGLNLDIGSYRVNDPYTEIERNVHRAVTWQIKENVWIEGEQTPTDLKRLTGVIRRSGYRGYLPLETLGSGDPYVKVPALVDKARSAGLFTS